MSQLPNNHIIILGAGLCGSMLAIYLAKRGFQVSVFEKRPDLRKSELAAGRSINLALSHRGLKCFEQIGLIDKVRQLAIPMHGRTMHDLEGNLTFQPYGKQGQFINSISRSGLNALLLDAAEEAGATLYFGQACKNVDIKTAEVWLEDGRNFKADFIFGADGAFSILRSKLMRNDRFNYSQHFIEHGYKELSFPAKAGEFSIEPNSLHIWPRGGFMMIALPNLDKSFTVTLFLPFEGANSFEHLDTPENLKAFFQQYFPDSLENLPDLQEQFQHNPTSSLVTVKCYPWHRAKAMVIGDAAHAIVPFYGQGMNAAFEDCYVLNSMMDDFDGDWEALASRFQQVRKPDADAIADLALHNFIEMRDSVADEAFLLQKKIEARLHQAYPDKWIPLYTMVTFSDLRYSEALKRGRVQDAVMKEYMSKADFSHNPEEENLAEIITLLDARS